MSLHPSQRIRASKSKGRAPVTVRTLGVFYRGQFSGGEPDHYLALTECQDLKKRGLGDYINRGKAFRRFDTSEPRDTKIYGSSGRRGASLKIDEPIPAPGVVMMNGMMTRFVLGEPYARAAVKAWRR